MTHLCSLWRKSAATLDRGLGCVGFSTVAPAVPGIRLYRIFMNRIDTTFRRLRREGRKALIPFVTAGDPNLKVTETLAREFERRGADILELGFPFSDPVADGPVIQRASIRALKQGVTLKAVFQLTSRLRREGFSIPIVLLSYYNPIFRYGEKRFVKEAGASGIDGVVVPDLPVEEAAGLVSAGRKKRFHVILLVAPTSDRSRRKKIVQRGGGLLYYVSVTGTTGVRRRLPPELLRDVQSLKKMTRIPVCVGFGVSTPETAYRISRVADGIIVGSAIVQKLEKGVNGSTVRRVGHFVASLAREVHR